MIQTWDMEGTIEENALDIGKPLRQGDREEVSYPNAGCSTMFLTFGKASSSFELFEEISAMKYGESILCIVDSR